VLEVKGIRDEIDKARARTTRDIWVPGVNALGAFGHGAFGEYRDSAAMEVDFAGLVDRLTGSNK
jgi:type III restriction enzyme